MSAPFEGEQLRVSIQGEAGSYHDQAAGHFFGEGYEPIFCDNFDRVFEAVESGEADYAMSAVENSIYGGIGQVHDLLAVAPISIIGEITLGIHHSLVGHPGVERDDIKQVHSHPVALAQCADYIKNVLGGAKTVEESDTAGSVGVVKDLGLRSAAAIAPFGAAEQFGMQIIASNIEDNPANYTHFLALQRGQANPIPHANKTSLILEGMGDNKAGGLAFALGQFAARGLFVPRLEARPIKGEPWKPRWFVDVDSGSTPVLEDVLSTIADNDTKVRVLGTYVQGQTIG